MAVIHLACRARCRAVPATITAPVQSWTLCHHAAGIKRMVGVAPMAACTAPGNMNTMPVAAQNTKAAPVTISTQ